jgi:hypothetical protein
MIEIVNTKVYGLRESIIRSGYPMQIYDPPDLADVEKVIKEQDESRAFRLSKMNHGHNNFMKGIIVQFDIRYPEYFSPQLQRYNWIDIISSQSKMHMLMSREAFLFDDFGLYVDDVVLYILNEYLEKYKNAEDDKERERYFKTLLETLPSSYMKWMGVTTNYLQLRNIFHQRKNHKLEEWRGFCKWIEMLPHSTLITGKNENNNKNKEQKGSVGDIKG